LSFFEFVSKGLELSNDSSKRQSFSQFIRSAGDIGMYRHYHGPMYASWLALLHDVKVQREEVFRGGGLLIHFATATLILFGFWAAFPSLPPAAGLVACALFVFSRTSLVAATSITQHVIFTFFCVATLFAASFFFRSLDLRWFYVMMAVLALAFCTVETSALLVVAIVLAMLADYRRMRQRWPTLRSLYGPLAKGVAVFLAVMLLCWPKGIAQLGIAKGFLTLAYISVYRGTFSQFGTWDLWAAKYTAAPWEFTLLIGGVIAAFLLWRRFAHKPELLPWLAFIAVFLLITLKVTVPYTYYYAPLVAAFAVATAAAYGDLWSRWPTPWRFALPLAVVVSLVGGTIQYRQVAQEIHDQRPYTVAVMQLLSERPVPAGQLLSVPYQLVPTLHYYLPELETSGYDLNYPVASVADEMTSPQAAAWTLCEETFCAALDQYAPGMATERTLLDPEGPSGQPIYVVRVRRPQEVR